MNNGTTMVLKMIVSSKIKIRFSVVISVNSIKLTPNKRSPWNANILMYVSSRVAMPRYSSEMVNTISNTLVIVNYF